MKRQKKRNLCKTLLNERNAFHTIRYFPKISNNAQICYKTRQIEKEEAQ